MTPEKILITFSLLMFSSCSFFSDSISVELVIPEFPDSRQFPGCESWRIIYPDSVSDEGCCFAELIIDSWTGEEPPVIKMSKGVNLPVLVYPVYSDSTCSSFPAGGLFPDDYTGSLVLFWESGPAAEIIHDFALQGELFEGFNAVMLRDVIMEKSAEEYNYDPWFADPLKIKSRLGYGLFRESSVKSRETADFSIPASSGTWHCDNPFVPEIIADDGELQVRLYSGLTYRFFSEDEVISVFFNENYWIWKNVSTGASGYGTR